MPLNLRASKKLNNFNVGVSYRINDRSGKFLDARNVYSVQDRLDTRFGTSRYNALPLEGAVRSLTFFSKSDGSRYALAKINQKIFNVSEAGAHTAIKDGLSPLSVHSGATWNDRHIFAIGQDGLFSWDGTTFAQLGQKPPAKPSVVIASGGSLITTNKYRVAISFYASSIGFESNASVESDEVTATSPNLKILVSGIPATADNALVDTVYVYLKNITTDSEYRLVSPNGIPLGTTTFEILEESLSGQLPPINNGAPLDGGGKYLASFNSRLVYAGNSTFPNEVYFSEPDLPDAFDPLDTQKTLVIPGQGPVTGLGVGLFGDSVLDPFLVIFKAKSTRVYSEIGGIPKMVVLSEEIGCVSHNTIQVKNGVIYFLSEEGWRAIANGRFITNDQGEAVTLGNGNVDDIFKSPGFVYEINRNGLPKTFSVYYPTLDQYMTWVSEASNSTFTKAYVYEFDNNGFKPFEFNTPANCATIGETSNGRDIVLIGTNDGYLLKHSIMESKSDIDQDNDPVAINAFAVLPWMPDDGDFDATYNFRELILKAIPSGNPLTVKTFIDYNLASEQQGDYDFISPNAGFTLDESILDQDSFGDERSIVTARSDINRVGETLAVGFYQNEINSNIGLLSMQIDSSKNGNRNTIKDTEENGEGGFDSETGDYFPSVSESVQLAAQYLQQMQALIGNLGDVQFEGFSARFNEAWSSDGVEDTFAKIIKIQYTAPLVSLSASGSGTIREKGDDVTASTLAATVTKRSDPIAKIEFFLNNVTIPGATFEPPSNPLSGTQNFSWTGSFDDNVTFKVEVTDNGDTGGPSTVSASIGFTFVYPYYYGAANPGLSASGVSGLTKSIITSNANLNRIFTTASGNVYYFAYPASYGALTSILDENGFETFGDWTLRTENIAGLNGTPVSYRIYEFNNPVVAGTTNYTFKR